MTKAWLALALCAASSGCAGAPAEWAGTSPDHRRTFAVADEEGRACIVADRAERRCFDGISLGGIVFAPDGDGMAYPVEQEGKWVVMRDGRPGKPEDGIGELVFNPGGDRLAYTALRAGRWHVVVDGVADEPFDSIFAGTLAFDPTGHRIAYAASRHGSAFAVVDGDVGTPYDGIAQLRFSPDGRRVGYVARTGDRVALNLDRVPGPSRTAIPEYVFHPLQPSASYVSQDGSEWWVWSADGRAGPFLEARDLGYHPSSGRLFFVAKTEEGERVMAGDEPGPVYESVDPPVFSEQGSRWGYVAHDSLGSTVTLDGEVLDRRDWALDLTLSPDGDRWAYVARRGDADVVMDDRGVTELRMVVDGTLQFVHDGTVWACLAGDLGRRRLFVRVEGQDVVRPFSWDDFGGVAGSRSRVGVEPSATLEALRAWVAAEADIILGR